MSWSEEQTEKRINAALAGRRVDDVTITGDRVTLRLDDGRAVLFGLEGECCSRSYFTDPEQFVELGGLIIQKVELRSGNSGFVGNLSKEKEEKKSELKWHFLVFITNEGHVTIDWRNESNGYYAGEILFGVVVE